MQNNNIKLILKELLIDDVKPNHLIDVEWLINYLRQGSKNKAPLFLSLGESWTEAPPILLDNLKKVPRYTHGYQLSMYGLPRLRKAVTNYIQKTQQIPKSLIGSLYETAITWTGTRNSMFDFGRMLSEEYFTNDKQLIITTAPGWDYQGVFEPLGFKTKFISLDKEDKFFPNIQKINENLGAVNQKALVVINAQHNPTSVNWPPYIIERIIDICIEKSFAVLIDDAFFGIHNYKCNPTSSLRILLEKLAQTKKEIPWLAVRSFGKEFAINGWGIGAIIANPVLLDKFVNQYRINHTYNYAGFLQYALSEWINSKDSKQYTDARSKAIEENKDKIKNAFLKYFGYKQSSLYDGDCTNFLMFDIPSIFSTSADGTKLFLKECFEKTGILFSDAWPKPYNTINDLGIQCARMYVSSDSKVFKEMVKRLKEHGFHYNMDSFR